MQGRLIALGGLIGALAFPAGASAVPPIWEPAFGPQIAAITDADDAATTIALGTFSFPFYGVTHTGAETFGVSSNGLIEIGAGDPDNSPTGDEARMGPPKMAALWSDLNPANVPPDGGSVFMNTFNDDGDAAIDRVVFTWDSVFFGCETAPISETCRARVQVQLLETGRIVFGYDGVLLNQARDNYGQPLMPLIAQGGFVPPPGFVPEPSGVDLSEAVPFTGGALIFEEFRGEPVHFDLDQTNLVFLPADASSYAVSSPVDIGVSSTASTAGASVGDTVTFTHVVTNNGSVAVGGVSLADRLPDGATGSSATTAGACIGSGPIGCAIGDLAPGASATVTTTATLGHAGTALDRVEVATTTPGDGRGNNYAQSTVSVAAATDSTPVQASAKVPKQKLGKALKKGVNLNLICNEACFAEVKLKASLPSSKKATTVGTGVGEVAAAGTAAVNVPLTKAAKRALGDVRKAKFKAQITVADEAGNETKVKKSFKLK